MSKENGNIPERNTSQWKKNEKTINSNPVLKQARDTAEGLDKPADRYGKSGASHYGKGSRPRIDVNSKQYQDNFDKIFKQGKYKNDK